MGIDGGVNDYHYNVVLGGGDTIRLSKEAIYELEKTGARFSGIMDLKDIKPKINLIGEGNSTASIYV